MNIHVQRYADPSLVWESTTMPEDRSWIVFQPRDPSLPAQFWRRHEVTAENGATNHFYAAEGISPEQYEAERKAALAEISTG